ncbi:transmembrane protein 232-like [Watersipora subatra]|uniref:transmembrane protein 232-like n=1 Tax=Watersipora subatra TaxID=2589382 RepID=UPI00355C5525
MPIEKVPVVHRFGIISHNQRLNLQERLLKKAVEEATAQPYERGVRNPYELQESFVHQFNSASGIDEKEKYEEQARKHIERLKTKAGLSKNCRVPDKQLDEVWVDLTILSQCKGKIQEESLAVLLATLDRASFDQGHIQGLFFLAETVLYWLRTDAINSPYLRASEIQLLKMAYMVFLRLFYHHMVGDLKGHGLFKSRLFMYLDGLGEYQEAYSPYPNAHLCLRYVIEVGKVILLDDDLDVGEVKEMSGSQERSHFTQSSTASQPRSAMSAISRSVHDLTPTLWHSLDVWRCVTISGSSIEEALYALAKCGLGMSLESWIDGAAAMLILGEAAKRNLSTLRVLQNLACGYIPSSIIVTEDNHEEPSTAIHEQMIKSQQQEPMVKNSKNLPPEVTAQVVDDLKEIQEALEDANAQHKTPTNLHKITRQSQRALSREPVEYINNPETGKRANIGTKYHDRETVSPSTYGNSPLEDTPGIQGWQWELAVVYTDLLAELVMNASLTSIKKRALFGTHNVPDRHYHQVSPPPLESAGLLDMVYFHTPQQTSNDWSWRVRYSATQGLVQICGHLHGDNMADGLYNAAWRALVEANSHESDERVLEALKVGQVTVKQKVSTKTSMASTGLAASNAGSRLANGLAKRYLPSLPLVKTTPCRPAKKPLPKQPAMKKPAVVRTSLREESKLAALTDHPPIPDFNSRTSKDLMRIVEDQWRKDLQERLRVEEEQRIEELSQQTKTDLPPTAS